MEMLNAAKRLIRSYFADAFIIPPVPQMDNRRRKPKDMRGLTVRYGRVEVRGIPTKFSGSSGLR